MRSIWQGRRVRVRGVRSDDWPLFVRFNEDDYHARRSSSIWFPQSPEAVQQWTAKQAGAEPTGDQYRFIIETNDGEAVGTIVTIDCDRRNGTFKYGITLLAEHHRRGYAREAVQLVLRYYFAELGYQKATVTVYAFNEPSQRFHERLGFQLEGRLRRMIYTDGTHHDDLVYGLLREEFQHDLPPLDGQAT